MTPRTFVVESFNDRTGNGTASDPQTNKLFRFERADLADSMDGVAFIGECVIANVEGDHISNLSAREIQIPNFLRTSSKQ